MRFKKEDRILSADRPAKNSRKDLRVFLKCFEQLKHA